MATNEDMIDGRPVEYGLTLEELRELMEHRKHEAYETIQTRYNGVLEMCKKLYTSSNEGKFQLIRNLSYTII
jgi:Ca2+ transporting ATPase